MMTWTDQYENFIAETFILHKSVQGPCFFGRTVLNGQAIFSRMQSPSLQSLISVVKILFATSASRHDSN